MKIDPRVVANRCDVWQGADGREACRCVRATLSAYLLRKDEISGLRCLTSYLKYLELENSPVWGLVVLHLK